ncbi:MAG: hypothetical protein MZV70_48590 [Desulfobacterales bacterium]|nr:hypothetical protein [Desulfobacterales bacterium]
MVSILFRYFGLATKVRSPGPGLIDPPDPFDHNLAIAADAAVQKRRRSRSTSSSRAFFLVSWSWACTSC